MKIIKIFLILIFFISSLMIYGQNCSNYHIEKCRWTGDSFLYSRQSKNALFIQGMTSEFSITVYGGEEYYIAVNGDKKLGEIKIRVKQDNIEKTVLYDNSDYKYENHFYFKNENTQNLIIEITSLEEKKFSNSLNKYCLGVLVQFRNDIDKEISTGF